MAVAKKTHSKKTISKTGYTQLKRDVQKLLGEAESSASLGRLQAYWQIGDRIRKERLATEAGYHNSVLRDLVTDSGVAVRTLQRALTLRKTYSAVPKKTDLSWSHYRVLLQLKSDEERRFYEALTREQNFSARQLRRAVERNLFGEKRGGPTTLKRPKSPEYLYAAKVVRVVDADTLDLDVDLGFDVRTRQRVRLAHIDAPEIKTKQGRAARDFLTEQLLGAATVVAQTQKADLHGRYLGQVFVSSRTSSIEQCFKKGVYLNDLLVTAKHARVIA